MNHPLALPMLVSALIIGSSILTSEYMKISAEKEKISTCQKMVKTSYGTDGRGKQRVFDDEDKASIWLQCIGVD